MVPNEVVQSILGDGKFEGSRSFLSHFIKLCFTLALWSDMNYPIFASDHVLVGMSGYAKSEKNRILFCILWWLWIFDILTRSVGGTRRSCTHTFYKRCDYKNFDPL